MQIVDVNVLVALVIRRHAGHARAARWWEESAGAGELFGVPDLVWVGLVRTITNPRVLAEPLSFQDAWGVVAELAADRRCRPVGSGVEVMRGFAQIGIDVNARGNLVTDAYVAAVAVRLGASVVTFDRDFRKFDGVRIVEPA